MRLSVAFWFLSVYMPVLIEHHSWIQTLSMKHLWFDVPRVKSKLVTRNQIWLKSQKNWLQITRGNTKESTKGLDFTLHPLFFGQQKPKIETDTYYRLTLAVIFACHEARSNVCVPLSCNFITIRHKATLRYCRGCKALSSTIGSHLPLLPLRNIDCQIY